jgi:deazaflavin-dependent oxidoreductase (nitroreductase family)
MADLYTRVFTTVLDVHGKIYKATGGRIGHRMLGVPSLLVHAIGAKSGEPRTSALTYARDGDTYLVVPSNGGASRWPAWYHNLKAHPDVAIHVGPKRIDVHATFVTPSSPDYPRLWAIVNKNNSNRYSAYQKRTTRPLPVIVLAPLR